MNNPNLTADQQETVDKFEFAMAQIKEQDLLYSSFRKLLKELPNNYELGAAIRKLFSE